jgi:hypothetical protein
MVEIVHQSASRGNGSESNVDGKVCERFGVLFSLNEIPVVLLGTALRCT